MGSQLEDELGRVGAALVLVSAAIQTDGAHHKNWYLDQIARVLINNEEAYQKYRDGHIEDDVEYYDEGIAP